MKKYLQAFLKEKPFFFSIVRPKEASLYQQYKPFKKPILDLGCGDGFFAKIAFRRLDVGVDPDKQAVKEAKTRGTYKEVRTYDGKKIPYPGGYFATIVCNSTFEHIPNLKEVLSEVARVIKKDGMLYFTVPTNIWPKYLFGRLFLGRFYERFFVAKSKHYNLWTLGEWQKELKKRDLEIIYSTHYLDNKLVMWIFDISHYLSIFSLIAKKVFNRWVLFPQKSFLIRPIEDYILKSTNVNSKKGPYMLIAARKTK